MLSVREEIAKNLLFYRKRSGLTQAQLAEKIGAKNTAVSNWEKCVNSMDIDTLHEICIVFGISINDMFGIYANTNDDLPKIFDTYKKLNGIGKKKADDYIKDLADNPKYTKTTSEQFKEDIAAELNAAVHSVKSRV